MFPVIELVMDLQICFNQEENQRYLLESFMKVNLTLEERQREVRGGREREKKRRQRLRRKKRNRKRREGEGWKEGSQEQCVHAKSLQSCLTLYDYGLQSARLLCPWNSPSKNTRVGCHALLQGIFPTQRWKPASPQSPTLAGGFLPTSTTWEALMSLYVVLSIRGKT